MKGLALSLKMRHVHTILREIYIPLKKGPQKGGAVGGAIA